MDKRQTKLYEIPDCQLIPHCVEKIQGKGAISEPDSKSSSDIKLLILGTVKKCLAVYNNPVHYVIAT